jgi:hypothetical protein
MRLRHRTAVAFGMLALAAAAALAAQARSTASGWTRVSGPTQSGQQLGLARTTDGVLHVIWNRGQQTVSIFETKISPAGKPAGTSTVASGWTDNAGLAEVVMPDGTLQLFAPGTGGINAFTAPAAGGTWTHQAVAGWGTAVAEASGIIGATLTKDGQPVTAWRGDAAEGVPPASVPQDGYQGGMTESLLATDAATGGVVLAGATNAGQGGVYVQQVLPSLGAKVVLPSINGNDFADGLSSRVGAAGVYVAYADYKAARLYRYGGGSRTLATGAFRSATVCAGPEGRLWVAWGDPTDGLFVTRSNRAVGSFEPVQKLAGPGGGLLYLQCEGSAGPVDVFASAAPDTGFFHTHLLAQFSLSAHAAKGKVTISARDAGDPVAGAAITVGGKHLKTDAEGRATLALHPGSYSASATAAGYAPASARFKV